MVFSLIVSERKKEFAIMRILGATKKTVTKSMLSEALIVSTIGSAIGSIISLVLLTSFNRYIKVTLDLPYVSSSALVIAAMFVIVLLACVAVSALAVLMTASDINNAETFITMKEGD
jgi:putative ABC transport system permease protein